MKRRAGETKGETEPRDAIVPPGSGLASCTPSVAHLDLVRPRRRVTSALPEDCEVSRRALVVSVGRRFVPPGLQQQGSGSGSRGVSDPPQRGPTWVSPRSMGVAHAPTPSPGLAEAVGPAR